MLFLEKKEKEKQAGEVDRKRVVRSGDQGDLLDFITPRYRMIMEKKIASLFRERTESEE